VDANGAKELQKRLEAHEQWRQAQSVLDGRQAASDPDLVELEEIGDGVRHYGLDVVRVQIDGRPAEVATRMTKTLIDGAWKTSLVEESVEFLDAAPAGPVEAT
jgi:hypothetical protein